MKTKVARQAAARVGRTHRRAAKKRRRARRLAGAKKTIERRLEDAAPAQDSGRPVMGAGKVRYELAERTQATSHGGIALAHRVAVRSGLVAAIDRRVHLLKIHRPYHESDHVLNVAFNGMCGGQTLDDIELRRNDAAFLDALGAKAIPDPTTAGDFCRRFQDSDIHDLMGAVNDVRPVIWAAQGSEFTSATAVIDADGTMVPTTGERKQGMDLSYKGDWGYLPLLVSFANTGEPLFIVNRSGNRPSHEGAPKYFDQAVTLCRSAGFTDILLRGDTDFSLTREFDRWDDDGVRFIFGYDANATLVAYAEDERTLDEAGYRELCRRAEKAFAKTQRRERQPRVKEQIVRDRGYKNIRLKSEDIAEFVYQPRRCRREYRFVVLRKNLSVERGAVPVRGPRNHSARSLTALAAAGARWRGATAWWPPPAARASRARSIPACSGERPGSSRWPRYQHTTPSPVRAHRWVLPLAMSAAPLTSGPLAWRRRIRSQGTGTLPPAGHTRPRSAPAGTTPPRVKSEGTPGNALRAGDGADQRATAIGTGAADLFVAGLG